MPEVAHAGEHHRHAALVGGGDHLLVAHRAARLDHRRGAGLGAASRPSAKGKKASEATTEPLVRGSASAGRLRAPPRAFQAAMRAESTRLIWPAPMPTVAPSLAIDDGVGLDVLGDGEGEHQVAQLALPVGARWSPRCSSPAASAHCPAPAPATRRRASGRSGRRRCGSGRPPVTSRRRFFFVAKHRARLVVDGGRDDHLQEQRRPSPRAVAASSGRLTATMPPKALTGSQAQRLAQASVRVAPMATPHGLACLMMATRRRRELGDQLEGGVGIVEVVVAELLALHLLGAGDARPRRRRSA